MAVLGSCVQDNAMIDEVAAWISEADFYRPSHAEIWSAILAIRDRGQAADFVMLADYLITRGRFEAIGGDETLRAITESVPHAANAVYYARLVREKSIGRQLLEVSEESIDELYSNQFTAADLIERVESRIFAITDRAVVGETIDAGKLTDETYSRLAMLRESRTVGLPTGYMDLDHMTGGFMPGQFIILAARPSMGKTALALNIASQVAAEGIGVMFESLEMGRVELGNRMLSSFGNVSGEAMLKPWMMPPEQWDRIHVACAQISRFPMFVDDTPVRTAQQIAANGRRIKHRKDVSLGLIVIDYLSLIDGRKQKGESRQDEVARISRRLRQAAKDLRVPILCLHQLNRAVEHRDEKRPRMADLRESGQIEQDADLILLLHRPEYYDPNDKPGLAEVIVAKNRNGGTGTVNLTFVKHLTRFDSFAPAAPAPTDGQPY